MIIDSHAHIYSNQFKDDRDAAIKNAQAAGITKILMPNIDSSYIDRMHQVAADYPDVCIPMMGLHPCYVTEHYLQELAIVEKYLQERKDYCAMGEIGLDYYHDLTYVEEQKKAFIAQIEMALAYKLPIVIHSRESTQACIDIIKPYIEKGLRGVFHCYSGTLAEAQAIISMGFYLGIGGVLTYKKAGLDELIKNIPLAHLILETDAPYLAPVPYRGKRNEPAYTAIVWQKMAEVLQVSVSEIAEITTQNCYKLFKMS